MDWQRSYIERDLSLGATSGTRTIDLPKSAMLSELLLRITATNNSSNPNRSNHIHDKISKIEVIVNGSEVVKSLTAVELQALAFFDTRKFASDWTSEDPTGVQWEEFPIHFGRYPGDLEYGLDCKKVTNPQLKITWDTTTQGSEATDLFSTTTYPVLDLSALQLIDGPPTFPKGYIKSHEIDTWSPTTNSAEKRFEMPVGNLFRRIMVRNYTVSWWQHQKLARAYLDLNVGVRQPFKMDIEDWIEMNRQLVGCPPKTRHICAHGNAKSFRSDFGNTLGQSLVALYSGGHFLVTGGSGNNWTIFVWDDVTSALYNGDISGYWTYQGDAYHNCLFIPFDWPNDDFLLDSKKWTDVDLVLEAAAAGISTILPTIAVVLEEVIAK